MNHQQKAIFLDRDGVLNRERGEYTYRVEDFEILSDVGSCLKELSDAGYLLIVVTNQSGIAKGLYSKGDVEIVHNYLKNELKKFGVELAGVYFCPHHPDFGKCLCRKPQSSMIERAMARFKIDASQSFLIGDKERDVEAGERVGVKGIQIPSNTSLKLVMKEIIG